MAVLGTVFNVVLFLSLTGGVFTVLSLLAKQAFRLPLPLWFGVCGMALYCVPVLMPALRLVPPEPQVWHYGYRVAAVVWAAGAAAFAAGFGVRAALARRALRGCRVCGDERIRRVLSECREAVGLKREPALYFSALAEPVCVVSLPRPAILLNEAVAARLSEAELAIVLCHECLHLRRGHPGLRRVFDGLSALHWANPFVWIAKHDFAAACEMDCDRAALTALAGRATEMDYARAMLRLAELSSEAGRGRAGRVEALGFFQLRQRMFQVLNAPAGAPRRRWQTAVLALLLAAALALSLSMSRGYFYPYPAYDTGPERAAYSEAGPVSLSNKTTFVVIRRPR